LRVLENRVLRRIFGPKWEEVAGGWRKLHSEELHNLYALSNIIRVGGAGGRYGRDAKCIQNFSRNSGREETTRKI
jgi:hypothetical protein